MTLIAPSLLAADPLKFADEVASVEQAGADWHHVDVMDGHFVPNLTFGLPFVTALKRVSKIPLDVHIMIDNPDEMAIKYVEAGADYLTFHIEAARHPHRLLQQLREAGCKPGVSINPGTPIESLSPLLQDLELINVMSVNPGFGGQSFIPATIDRVAKLSKLVKSTGSATLIEVDGGVTDKTFRGIVEAGADVLVAGTFVYRSANRKQAISALK